MTDDDHCAPNDAAARAAFEPAALIVVATGYRPRPVRQIARR